MADKTYVICTLQHAVVEKLNKTHTYQDLQTAKKAYKGTEICARVNEHSTLAIFMRE